MDEDDIDEYLYGEDTAKNLKEAPVVAAPATDKSEPDNAFDEADLYAAEGLSPGPPVGAASESLTGQAHPDKDGHEAEEEEDDNEVEIVLEEAPATEPSASSLFQKLTSISTARAEANGAHSSLLPLSTVRANALDIHKVGEYEGQGIFNLDLDSMEDKPWRKPGADISDYFNFGFDENLWRQYCQKQKSLRDENMLLKKIQVYETNESKPRSVGPVTRHGFGQKNVSNIQPTGTFQQHAGPKPIQTAAGGSGPVLPNILNRPHMGGSSQTQPLAMNGRPLMPPPIMGRMPPPPPPLARPPMHGAGIPTLQPHQQFMQHQHAPQQFRPPPPPPAPGMRPSSMPQVYQGQAHLLASPPVQAKSSAQANPYPVPERRKSPERSDNGSRSSRDYSSHRKHARSSRSRSPARSRTSRSRSRERRRNRD